MKKYLFSCLLFCLSSSVDASIVTWHLHDVTLSDGQSLTGMFDYDTSNQDFTNISIVNSGTVDLPSMEFNMELPNNFCNSLACRFTDDLPSTGLLTLLLTWDNPLNKPGLIQTNLRQFDVFNLCTDDTCTSLSSFGMTESLKNIMPISGFISTAPVTTVPIPTAIWLFGSGLIGLIGMRKNLSKTSTLSA